MKIRYVFILLILSSVLQAQTKYGVDFLNGPSDIRYVGGGSSFIALPRDAGCINYNPAGIATLDGTSAQVSFVEGIAETSRLYLNFTRPLAFGQVGFSLNYNSYGSFPAVDASGATYEDLAPTDTALALGYATSLSKLGFNAYAGVIVKGFMNKSYTYENYGICADIGAVTTLSFMKIPFEFDDGADENLSIGVSLRNIGAPVKAASETAALPRTFTGGVGYRVFEVEGSFVDLAFSAGLNLTDSYVSMASGLEASWQDILFLRLGYKINSENPYSLGLGVKNYKNEYAFKLDFSFTLHDVDSSIGLGVTLNI